MPITIMRMKKQVRGFAALWPAVCLAIVSLFSAGCAVGPKYVRPAVPMPSSYRERAVNKIAETQTWQVAQPGGAAGRVEWW